MGGLHHAINKNYHTTLTTDDDPLSLSFEPETQNHMKLCIISKFSDGLIVEDTNEVVQLT